MCFAFAAKKGKNMPKASAAKSSIEDAYRAIKQLMLKQQLIPGQKLLYRELTARLGMSKTPIVNALNRLEQEGFVISEPNVGYAVKPINAKEIFDSYEVREALEIKALSNALEKATEEQITVLEDKYLAFHHYQPHQYDKKKLMLDCEFHLQIALMSGNEVLRYLLRRNFEHTLLRTRLENYAPERMERSARDHKNILEMIKIRDFPESAALLTRHIRNARDYVLLCISREDKDNLDTLSLFEFGL